MNSLRGSTLSPISIVKSRSAAAASSIVTCASVRVVGFIVVVASCSAFISPRPLKRCSLTPLPATVSTARRSSSNVAASSDSSPSATVNGGTPASLTSSTWTRASWRYSLASNIERRRRCVRARFERRSVALIRITPSSVESSSV